MSCGSWEPDGLSCGSEEELASCGKNSWLSAVFLPLWARLPSLRCSELQESARRQARISASPPRLRRQMRRVSPQLTAPHVLTAGQDGVSVTRFTNQSGLGGATATHVVLSATFSAAVTVKGVTLFVNGSPVSTASCSPASLATPVATVSCPVGTIAGASSAKLVVRFSAPTARTVAGSASYGEGGNDSAPPRPNGSKNDLQTSRDSFTIAGTSAQGNCFDSIRRYRLWLHHHAGHDGRDRRGRSVARSAVHSGRRRSGHGRDSTHGIRRRIWFTDFLAVDQRWWLRDRDPRRAVQRAEELRPSGADRTQPERRGELDCGASV